MRVLAIDFETANANISSACSIGFSLWNEGEVLVSDEIYIKPHQSLNYFQYQNIRIHGISPEMVEYCEEWPMVFWEIRSMFRDSVVVAHNAAFDMAVLRGLNRLYEMEMDDFPYLDTVQLSRAIHPYLENHKLNTVCDYLGLRLQHHDAKSDSLGCLAIVENAMETYQEYDIEELMRKMFLHPKYFLSEM